MTATTTTVLVPIQPAFSAAERLALAGYLISLLALNGLRVSEATGADIEQLGLDREHRTLTITRKGVVGPVEGMPGRGVFHRGAGARVRTRPAAAG